MGQEDFIFDGMSVIHNPEHAKPNYYIPGIKRHILDIGNNKKKVKDIFIIVTGLLQQLSLRAAGYSEKDALIECIGLDELWINEHINILLKCTTVEGFPIEITKVNYTPTSSKGMEKVNVEKETWKQRADCILKVVITSSEINEVFYLNYISWYKILFETDRIAEVKSKLTERINELNQTKVIKTELPLIFDPTVYRTEFLVLSCLTQHLIENCDDFRKNLGEAVAKYCEILKKQDKQKTFDRETAEKFNRQYDIQEIAGMLCFPEIRYSFVNSEVGKLIRSCLEEVVNYVKNEDNKEELSQLSKQFIENYPFKFTWEFLRELKEDNTSLTQEIRTALDNLMKTIQDLLEDLQSKFETGKNSPSLLKKQSPYSEIALAQNMPRRWKSLEAFNITKEVEQPFQETLKKQFEEFLNQFPIINEKFEEYKKQFAAQFKQHLERIKNFLVIDNTPSKSEELNASKQSIAAQSSNANKVSSGEQVQSPTNNTTGNRRKNKGNKSERFPIQNEELSKSNKEESVDSASLKEPMDNTTLHATVKKTPANTKTPSNRQPTAESHSKLREKVSKQNSAEQLSKAPNTIWKEKVPKERKSSSAPPRLKGSDQPAIPENPSTQHVKEVSDSFFGSPDIPPEIKAITFLNFVSPNTPLTERVKVLTFISNLRLKNFGNEDKSEQADSKNKDAFEVGNEGKQEEKNEVYKEEEEESNTPG